MVDKPGLSFYHGAMILRGWKEICRATGGLSPKSARNLMRYEGLPVTFLAGSPMTTVAALTTWLEQRCQKPRGPLEPPQAPH